MNRNNFVKIDDWVNQILRDPLDKSILKIFDNYLASNYGKIYKIVNGIYDLRLLQCKHGSSLVSWKNSQERHEKWSFLEWEKEKHKD